MAYCGFILSSTQVQRQNTARLIFQGRLSDGMRFHWSVSRPRIVFFIDRNQEWTPPEAVRKTVKLKNLRGGPVDALYFRSNTALNRARKACEDHQFLTYEADVNPIARFLMEHFIQGSVSFESEPVETKGNCLYFIDPKVKPSDFTPQLRTLSVDIECSMKSDLYSIALFGEGLERVLMIDSSTENGTKTKEYQRFRSERGLLEAFFSIVREYDPDLFVGWNLIGFDLRWLSRKCTALGIRFDIGTDGPAEMLEPRQNFNQWIARIPGRAALDGINMARSAYVKIDDYSLSTVAHEILGRKKLIEKSGQNKVAEITRLFHEDKVGLAQYNLEDARLVHEIFEKLNLAQLAVRRSQLTGLALDRIGGSVAAYDFLYLPRLHRKGFVADTDPRPPIGAGSAPGGLVLDSLPGFYSNVAVLDFKSLYPSIIRTFMVDPLAGNMVLHDLVRDSKATGRIVKGPAGLEFASDWAILPGIIEHLWRERDKAKQSKDATLSQAVKIIMNSFYGVLGSQGCRFYDPRIAGSITRIGHWILNFSREFIEKRGFVVIYGDTDSLFVHLGEGDQKTVNETGHELSKNLNRYLKEELERRFKVESCLDIEFEKIFVRFFMPTIRGRDAGSKKRYAGLLMGKKGKPELYFAGMESSRRDWTALAKDFQANLFELIFQKYDTPDLKDKLSELVRSRQDQLYAGELDHKLVYRKGISKRLEDYTKTIPPHVRAARMLDKLDGRIVRYVMTTAGPEPIQKRSGAAFNYDHYSEKQLSPVADMVLRVFDMDFRSLTTNQNQLNLFQT